MTLNFLLLWPFYRPFRALDARHLLRGRQQGISGQVVGHVTQPDLGLESDYANATHEGASGAHRHDAKYMFNAAPGLRSDSIRLALFVCQLSVPVALQLQMLLKPLLCQLLQRFF